MIGIFDSGSGGLTVLSAVKKLLPSVDVVYFGDTKHAPYGGKSREALTERTIAAIQILAHEKATSVLSACNSVSASLAVSLFDAMALPPERLIEMVGPTVAHFRGSSARVLLCATEATIASQVYQNAFHMIGKDIKMLAIPALAGAIEAGASEEELTRIIHDAFDTADANTFDTVVLACTHYPLVSHIFEKVLESSVIIYDPADAVAARVEHQWWPRESGNGTLRFLISAESEVFRACVARLFPHNAYSIEVIE
jgi:glutamate racemase